MQKRMNAMSIIVVALLLISGLAIYQWHWIDKSWTGTIVGSLGGFMAGLHASIPLFGLKG